MDHTHGNKIVRARRNGRQGQAFLEFSFAIIMTVLLMVGMVKVFLWTGRDLVNRRQKHEEVLTENCTGSSCPYRQLRQSFYRTDDIRATVNSDIFE